MYTVAKTSGVLAIFSRYGGSIGYWLPPPKLYKSVHHTINFLSIYICPGRRSRSKSANEYHDSSSAVSRAMSVTSLQYYYEIDEDSENALGESDSLAQYIVAELHLTDG